MKKIFTTKLCIIILIFLSHSFVLAQAENRVDNSDNPDGTVSTESVASTDDTAVATEVTEGELGEVTEAAVESNTEGTGATIEAEASGAVSTVRAQPQETPEEVSAEAAASPGGGNFWDLFLSAWVFQKEDVVNKETKDDYLELFINGQIGGGPFFAGGASAVFQNKRFGLDINFGYGPEKTFLEDYNLRIGGFYTVIKGVIRPYPLHFPYFNINAIVGPLFTVSTNGDYTEVMAAIFYAIEFDCGYYMPYFEHDFYIGRDAATGKKPALVQQFAFGIRVKLDVLPE